MLSLRPRPIAIASLIAAAVTSMGCQTDNGIGIFQDEGTQATAPRGEAQLTDSQIARVVTAVNQGEIDLAQLALERSESTNVRDYAQLMIRDHRQAQELLREAQQQGGFSTASSNIEQDLTAQVDRIRRDLTRQQAGEFDRAYIDSQVSLHDRALRLIDDRLLTDARSDAMRSHLETLRPILENHRQIAQEVRQGRPVATR